MGHGDHEGVERKRPPDGQPVPYRSRCQGRQYCSLNSPPGGSSSRHRGLEQRYCLPPDANTPSLRSKAQPGPDSCPIIQSVTRRRPGPPHGPETPHAAHRRRTALARQPAPGPHDNHPRRTSRQRQHARKPPRAHSKPPRRHRSPRQDGKDTDASLHARMSEANVKISPTKT